MAMHYRHTTFSLIIVLMIKLVIGTESGCPCLKNEDCPNIFGAHPQVRFYLKKFCYNFVFKLFTITIE